MSLSPIVKAKDLPDDEEAHVRVTPVAGHVKVLARRHDSDLNLEIQALAFNSGY
jgi:hypothetical protein